MSVSIPPPASSDWTDEAKRNFTLSCAIYSGLMPSRSRARVVRPESRSTTPTANIPANRAKHPVPQRWNALSTTSLSASEKKR